MIKGSNWTQNQWANFIAGLCAANGIPSTAIPTPVPPTPTPGVYDDTFMIVDNLHLVLHKYNQNIVIDK